MLVVVGVRSFHKIFFAVLQALFSTFWIRKKFLKEELWVQNGSVAVVVLGGNSSGCQARFIPSDI